MSTLQIGRAVLDRCVTSLSFSGDDLSVSGTFQGASLNEARLIRQQLLGLVDNSDEIAFPVISALDPYLDGFYRVISAVVAPIPGVTYRTNDSRVGRHVATLQMRRVRGGFSLPPQEVTVATATRSGGYVVTPQPRLWIPNDVSWQGAGVSVATRVADSGSVMGLDTAAATTVLPAEYTVTPANHYDGGCLIEAEVTSGVWRPLIGNQVPAGLTLRIGNGIVRFTAVAPSSLHVWDGSAWDLVGQFSWAVGFLPDPIPADWPGIGMGAASIIQNGPEAAAIVIDMGSAGRLYVGISRGDHAFVMNVGGPYMLRGALSAWYILSIPPTAATAIAGAGIRQTANGATGHRWIMDAAKTSTADLVNGRITLTTPDSPHLLGVELLGSLAAAHNTAANVRAQWWAAISQRQTVTSR